MTGPLYRLGRVCVRHHWLVIGAWVAAVAALAIAASAAGSRTSDNLTLPDSGSQRAADLLTAKLPQQAYGSNPLVMRATHGKLTDSANAQAVDATATALAKVPHVTKATSPLSPDGTSALSKDQTIGYVPVVLDVGPSDLTESEAQAVLDAAQPARAAGLDVALGGYAGQRLSKPSTEISEVVGLAAAVVILLFAFGTATAMLLPIATAVLGLVAALSIVELLSHAVQIPTIAPTLATMIGLGVGIDYALFVITRHRLQRRGGLADGESAARATATAGGAVAFAGTTVVIALVALAAAGIPIVTALGYSAAIAVVVAVLAATTLLPALLGALGARIDALAVHRGATPPDDHRPHGWERWARAVAGRPRIALVASVVVLLVLAIPVLQLQLGQSDTGALPTSTTARQAYDLMERGFGVGSNGPLLVATSLGTPAKPAQSGESASTDPRLTGLQHDIGATAGVASVSPAVLDQHGDAAVLTVVATTAPSSTQTEDLVHALRDHTIPSALAGTDAHADVGGQTASYIDLASQISATLPWMILLVVALSIVVLTLAFRSVAIPLKAAVMNLLSVGAAYGVVTAVFQLGWGASLLGLDGAIPIVSYVPLLMFAILFGLSMDYEVFLVTQIQEHYEDHRDPTRAVIEGLAGTGRVITSAALIMVCVFASFVLNGDPIVKQFGVGLAVAIALDATIVRCLLVPAVMVRLGHASWWLPRWAAHLLPRINVEGGGYFAALDAETAAAAAVTTTQPAGGDAPASG